MIDRLAAARLGVAIQSIDDALNNAFGERQISTIYTQRNQYRVVLEVAPRAQRDPADISKIYVPGKGGEVPLSAFAHLERGSAALVVNHQGAFPSVTISYNLAPNVALARRQRGGAAGRRRDAPARTGCMPNSPATPSCSSRAAAARAS